MLYAKELTRTKHLIAKGRYKKGYSKDISAFKPIASEISVKINQITYTPYFYAPLEQVVFGTIEKQNTSRVMHFLSFTNFDYTYGSESVYIWFDKDEDPFVYLED